MMTRAGSACRENRLSIRQNSMRRTAWAVVLDIPASTSFTETAGGGVQQTVLYFRKCLTCISQRAGSVMGVRVNNSAVDKAHREISFYSQELKPTRRSLRFLALHFDVPEL